MIRKVIAFLLITVFAMTVCSVAVFAANVEFPDVGASHWAYKYVSVLVNDGTVKGYENGYFQPNKMVSRAEFVKMIGKGNEARGTDFADVPKTHWGYDYIMTSGLNGVGNNMFDPSVPMTREQTAVSLWIRAGKPTGIIAPDIITKQAANKDAVSWIYMYGVMIGSDGLNLRLGDPVSRAEAATLIVRAREINDKSAQINFVDAVSSKLLETVYKSINLFDMPYDPERAVTNGEMARAAVRLASEEFNLTYRNFSVKAPFDDIYAKDLAIIGKCIGQDKVNATFIKQYANNIDTVAALSYAAILKAHTPPSYGNANNYYKDAPEMDKNLENTVLTFAYENGIQLYSKGLIMPAENVTLKNIAAILLQLDDKIGLQSIITTDNDTQGKSIDFDMKLVKDVGSYPQNSSSFACILSGIPSELYTYNFENMPTLDGSYGKNPATTYNFVREYSSMFINVLMKYKADLKQKDGIDVRFTYIPSLVCDNKKGFTLRVKCEIIALNGKSVAYKDVFTGPDTENSPEKLYDGMTFYADAVTDYTMGTGVGAEFAIGKMIYKEK